ncbi:MAG TPA: hypothetical protein VHZ50_05140 [Puia sp.]|jgi:hypothetical protein|nr:hypothetical protein [Puia sp.]
MKQKITETTQGIVIYKINPNERELNREVDFDQNVHGRILTGSFFICDQTLIVEDDNQKVTGIFSLHHFYFLKSSNH